MRNHLSDTNSIAEKKLINILRESSVSRKLSLAFSLSSLTRQLSYRALVRKNPDASEQEINLLFVKVNYGEILANKLKLHYSRSSVKNENR
jgi:hypothetical protein